MKSPRCQAPAAVVAAWASVWRQNFPIQREAKRHLLEEDQRHMRENLTEEELAIFDILTRPDLYLTGEEEQQVKQVAHDLLATLANEKLVLDWRRCQQSRAAVRLAIEDMLYERLPERYSEEVCERKRDDVYQHVCSSYWRAGQGVYAVA